MAPPVLLDPAAELEGAGVEDAGSDPVRIEVRSDQGLGHLDEEAAEDVAEAAVRGRGGPEDRLDAVVAQAIRRHQHEVGGVGPGVLNRSRGSLADPRVLPGDRAEGGEPRALDVGCAAARESDRVESVPAGEAGGALEEAETQSVGDVGGP